jgi:hypothetical protein
MMIARDIAARLGLRKYPRSWRGQCPCCEYPGGTFSVLAARDGTARLFCASGCNHDDLTNAVARATGQHVLSMESNVADADARDRNRERALALWRGSEPATSTLADGYLTARGLPGSAASPALRYRADTPHPEGGRLPAMIALVVDVDGVPLGIHRTYLCRDGSKARVEPAKASLGPIWGGAIRLQTLMAGTPLIIGEGIESAASAGRLMGLPAWAALSAGNLGKSLLLPLEARSVVIAADPDPAGERAAAAAALRWSAERRTVQIARPTGEGDFNDLLLTREKPDA